MSCGATTLLVLLLLGSNGVRPDLGGEPVTPGQQRQSLQDNDEAQGGLGYWVKTLVQFDEGHAFGLCRKPEDTNG